MDYIQTNKAAWEEAFDRRKPRWGEDVPERLLREKLPFLHPDLAAELSQLDLLGKHAAQFCCNNGRELLSLMRLGPASGTGFDLADNIVSQARDIAKRAGIQNCEFVAVNLLDIPDTYRDRFDLILFTIGALAWFEDLAPVFAKVSQCLRENGTLCVHDAHPFFNMLPIPGEDCFDSAGAPIPAYSYFKADPWVETHGMSYMTGRYASKPFISFSHTMGDLITSVAQSGLCVTKLREFDRDVGMTDVYDGKGVPLSYLLTARKR